MGFWAIIEVITAVLKAPAEIRALIILLSKTPEEKRQEIMARVQRDFDESAKTGRPTFGS